MSRIAEMPGYTSWSQGVPGSWAFTSQALLDREAQVVGLDNFNDYSPSLKRDRDLELRKFLDFVSVCGDIADGQDADSELIVGVRTTPGNVPDGVVLPELIDGHPQEATGERL